MAMKISLIHPSRGRADKSFETSKKWTSTIGDGIEWELVVSLDYSDKEIKKYESNYFQPSCDDSSCHKPYHPFESHVLLLFNHNTSVVEATNRSAKAATGDILIYLSDDFSCPPNWGALVLKEFEGEERPLLLKVHDNLQDFNARVITIPMMNRLLYEKLNYFWHPEYKSMWVDCDLFETVNRIGALKNARHLVFPHEHHSIGKAENDATYKASEANWDQGLKVFNRRKAERFPI